MFDVFDGTKDGRQSADVAHPVSIDTAMLTARRVAIERDYRGVPCIPHAAIRIEINRDGQRLLFDFPPGEAVRWAERVIDYARGITHPETAMPQVGGLPLPKGE